MCVLYLTWVNTWLSTYPPVVLSGNFFGGSPSSLNVKNLQNNGTFLSPFEPSNGDKSERIEKSARREDLGLTRLLAQGSKGVEHKFVIRNTRSLDIDKVNVENIRLSRVKIDYSWQIGLFFIYRKISLI